MNGCPKGLRGRRRIIQTVELRRRVIRLKSIERGRARSCHSERDAVLADAVRGGAQRPRTGRHGAACLAEAPISHRLRLKNLTGIEARLNRASVIANSVCAARPIRVIEIRQRPTRARTASRWDEDPDWG